MSRFQGDNLTDTYKYTGSHKHRFDDGKCLKGTTKGAGMSPGSVGSQASYDSGYKNEGSYNKKTTTHYSTSAIELSSNIKCNLNSVHVNNMYTLYMCT